MTKRERQERRIGAAMKAGRRWQERTQARTATEANLLRGGPAAAETERRKAKFEQREVLRGSIRVGAPDPFPVVKERMIGPTLDFSAYAPDEEARHAGLPVARIVEIPAAGMMPYGFGTGFLVCPGLLLTNHHVLATRRDAYGVGANFGHEYTSAGLATGTIFELDPDLFFDSDEELDFALVAVKPKSTDGRAVLDDSGYLPLIGTEGKILIGHPISIIQHPSGGPKQYATTQNKLLDVLDAGFLHYTTDTLQGSSGSPAFNQFWEVVGLHHSGVPMIHDGAVLTKDGRQWDANTMTDDEIHWIANEAIRISAIVAHLRAKAYATAPEQEIVDRLLKGTGDPVAKESTLNLSTLTSFSTNAMGQISINIAGDAHLYFIPQESNTASSSNAKKVEGLTEAKVVVEEKSIRFDPNYTRRKGYRENFLHGWNLPLPTVHEDRAGEMIQDEDGNPLILKYHHFSLAMNADRRLQMWSAVNVDYTSSVRTNRDRSSFGSDRWIADPRIPGELQIQNEEYYRPATKMDRGHIVRREDNEWGHTDKEIEFANSDTFHWTNCTPQHEAFNQSKYDGLWGNFENYLTAEAGALGKRVSIFAGPVLDGTGEDREYIEGVVIKVPMRYWKIIAGIDKQGTARAYGFVFDQSDVVDRLGMEGLDITPFAEYHTSIAYISEITGVIFPDELLAADAFVPDGNESRRRVRAMRDIQPAAAAARDILDKVGNGVATE